MMMTLMDAYMYIDGESEDEGGDGDDGNGNDSGATNGDGHDMWKMVVMGMTVKMVVMGMTCEDGGDGQDGDNGADGDVAIQEYLGHPCCPRDMANKDPTDFFQLFVTDAMLEAAVVQTDLFAQQLPTVMT